MDFNWYGDNSLDRIRAIGGFSDKRGRIKLVNVINRLENDGLSHYEIQNALKDRGINVDTTTIRTILRS